MSRANRRKNPQPGIKRLTCFYWGTRGRCENSEDDCLYSHRDTGILAEEPKGKRNGVPSVAGKNARRPNPIRTDWRGKHGLPSPRKLQKPTLGESPSTRDSVASSICSPGLVSSLNPQPSSGITTAASPGPNSAFGSAPTSRPSTNRQTIEAYKRGSPSHKFTLNAIDPSKTPSWRKDSPTTSKLSLEKSRERSEEDQSTPKPKPPAGEGSTEVMTRDTKVHTPETVKRSTANKSTGGILLIAKNLRELANATALTRKGYAEPPIAQAQTSFQKEQLRDLRDQVIQVAAMEVDGKVIGSARPLMLTKAQAEWCEQRSKYTQSLRRYVDRCWDPGMELVNVFRRLNLWLPANGHLPEEIKRLCDERDHTERALRFYLGWIRFYTSDILELRRARNPIAQVYAAWGLDLMDYYLDTACPKLHATLQVVENKLVDRAVSCGLGIGQHL